DDFQVIKNNLEGGNRTTKDRLVPYCLFTEPPVAHVGLSEGDAQRKGIKIRVVKLPVAAVLRTATTGETRGFMKAILSDSDDTVIGFTMIGPGASELMSTVQMVILAKLPFTFLRDAILAHPTMAEGLGELFAGVAERNKSAVAAV
ncbi:MAG TPA: mercuric reductase, partial [Chroococcales cyanobacterium]